MKKPVILLDMDEVLVDFIGGALEIHGWTRSQLEAKREPGHWSILDVMGLSQEDFWKPINNQGADFWANLQPHFWIHELINLVEGLTDEWYVVTSPSEQIDSHIGKLRWLRGFFGVYWDRGIITRYKHLLATPGTILIDDREENIQQFIAVGGEGLLFPTMGGSLYRFSDDPVSYLAPLLKEKVNAPLLS